MTGLIVFFSVSFLRNAVTALVSTAPTRRTNKTNVTMETQANEGRTLREIKKRETSGEEERKRNIITQLP